MNTTLERRVKMDDKYLQLELPVRGLPVLSHKLNILYCIERLREAYPKYSKNNPPVIGYTLERSVGNIETDHLLMSRRKAKKIREEDEDFDYFTLNDLLIEQRKIEAGVYVVENGLIIDKNPNYSR